MTDRGNASRVKSGAKRIWRWLFIIYAIALTTATHWPRLDLGVNDHPAPDKFLHLFAFAGLTFLFWRTRWLGDRWLLLFVMFIWAAIDEWTQGLPGLGRNPNHADMLANWTGILLAFAWIRAMRPLGGPLNRLRHARSEMIFDSLPHRPRTWLLGFGFAIPSALLVGAGAGALTYYVDPEPIMHGALLGAILGGGLGAGAAIARAWPAHEQMLRESRPCFSCREPVENITFNDHGLSVCSSCGVAVHEAQWRISLALPRQQLQRAGLSAGPIAVGFVLALIALYVAVFLGTLQSQTFRTAVINWLPMELRIAIDLAMIGIVLAAAFRVFRHRIAARFDAQGRTCRHCNHDLNATPVERGVGRCGECGTEFIRLPDPPPTLAGSP